MTCVHNPAGCECHRLYDEQVTGRTSDFRALLRRHDGCAVETSKAQLRKAQPPSGFGGVQPGDSMEAYMVEPQYADLFEEEDVDEAVDRLLDAGFDVRARMNSSRKHHTCPVHD